MSDTSPNPQAGPAFGIPEHNFLRLALDVLGGLEIQSRERGHDTLASLIEIARGEAAGGLGRLSECTDLPDEPKSLRLANALRTRALSVSAPQQNNYALQEKVAKKEKRKSRTLSGIDQIARELASRSSGVSSSKRAALQ